MTRTSLLSAATAALTLALAAPAAAAPANDNLAGAIAINDISKDVAYSTSGAGNEVGESLPAAGHTVWFKWTPAQNGGSYADVCGSGQFVHVYKSTGAASPKIADLENARNGDQSDAPLPVSQPCRFRWRAVAKTTYYVQIDRAQNAATSSSLVLNQKTTVPTWPLIHAKWGVTGPDQKVGLSHPDPAVTFVCSVDSQQLKACAGGALFVALKSGEHVFRARSMDAFGNVSFLRELYWAVDATAPETTVTSNLGAKPIRFTSSETGGAECSVDGGDFSPCSSPYEAPGSLIPGSHSVRIRAVDAVGNVDETPAETEWFVESPHFVVDPIYPPQNTTVDKPGVTQPAGVCALTLSAPRTTTRAALRRGLRVTVAASGADCAETIRLVRSGRTLAKRTVTVAAGTRVRVTLRTKAARRGTVSIVAGAKRRTVKVG